MVWPEHDVRAAAGRSARPAAAGRRRSSSTKRCSTSIARRSSLRKQMPGAAARLDRVRAHRRQGPLPGVPAGRRERHGARRLQSRRRRLSLGDSARSGRVGRPGLHRVRRRRRLSRSSSKRARPSVTVPGVRRRRARISAAGSERPSMALPHRLRRSRPSLHCCRALSAAVAQSTRRSRRVITIWHQVRPAEREVLRDEIARFEAAHPDVRIRPLYKETEELRSGFQAAALAGAGPELVYGPSDVLDTFHTMGLLQDMAPWFPASSEHDFVDGALTYLPSRKRPDEARAGAGRRPLRQPPGAGLQPPLHQGAAEDDRRAGASSPSRTRSTKTATAARTATAWSGISPSRSSRFRFSPATAPGSSPEPTTSTPPVAGARHARSRSPPIASCSRCATSTASCPANCDYELADSLFKTGRAAMIINGDWSWADYLDESGDRRRGRRAADRQLRPASRCGR